MGRKRKEQAMRPPRRGQKGKWDLDNESASFVWGEPGGLPGEAAWRVEEVLTARV